VVYLLCVLNILKYEVTVFAISLSMHVCSFHIGKNHFFYDTFRMLYQLQLFFGVENVYAFKLMIKRWLERQGVGIQFVVNIFSKCLLCYVTYVVGIYIHLLETRNIFVALGGLVVSVLATGPKVAGSNPAEDDGF
jgi:hypothetical protein